MRKALIISLLAALAICGAAATASAQNTANVTVTANIGAFAKLTLDQTTLTFANADPDAGAMPGDHSINITAKVRTTAGATSTLTVVADHDLQAAGNPDIPIGNISWTVTGTGFLGGSLATTAVNVFTHAGSHDTASGVQTFSMVNSWTYGVGSYTAHLTYTLSAL